MNHSQSDNTSRSKAAPSSHSILSSVDTCAMGLPLDHVGILLKAGLSRSLIEDDADSGSSDKLSFQLTGIIVMD